MANPTQTLSKTTSTDASWLWISASLAAHASWGIYPVLGRYLQTVSNLPTFSILLLGNLIVLVVLGRYLIANTNMAVFRRKMVWVFAFIVIIRAVTNIVSARLTLSIYVQLVTQATPFFVIFFSTIFFKEKLPRFTIPAITIATLGALMMIGPNFGTAPDDPTRRDSLGVTMALISVVALAMYMVLVRQTNTKTAPVSSEALLLIQLIAICLVSSGATLTFNEDWTQYTRIGIADWAVFLTFTFLVFLGANLWQIQAIQHIGAPLHSSMLASRLISALIFGWLLLDERLQSVWQLAGAALVLMTITWFLWQQRQRQ